jgi:hypothetical protein
MLLAYNSTLLLLNFFLAHWVRPYMSLIPPNTSIFYMGDIYVLNFPIRKKREKQLLSLYLHNTDSPEFVFIEFQF